MIITWRFLCGFFFFSLNLFLKCFGLFASLKFRALSLKIVFACVWKQFCRLYACAAYVHTADKTLKMFNLVVYWVRMGGRRRRVAVGRLNRPTAIFFSPFSCWIMTTAANAMWSYLCILCCCFYMNFCEVLCKFKVRHVFAEWFFFFFRIYLVYVTHRESFIRMLFALNACMCTVQQRKKNHIEVTLNPHESNKIEIRTQLSE